MGIRLRGGRQEAFAPWNPDLMFVYAKRLTRMLRGRYKQQFMIQVLAQRSHVPMHASSD
jgi:hypothetical protein